MEKELLDFIAGARIGVGCYRTVYQLQYDPYKDYVIKVASDASGRAVNLLESKTWWEISDTPIGKWFAPVIGVSDAGEYLIQRKVEALPKEQYPKKIPAFFTDTKYSNFGYLKGKGFVCCDFGSFNLFKGVSIKMKKADWWE